MVKEKLRYVMSRRLTVAIAIAVLIVSLLPLVAFATFKIASTSTSGIINTPWWNGDCDDTNYFKKTGVHSYVLHDNAGNKAIWKGIEACGPRPEPISKGGDGGPDNYVQFPLLDQTNKLKQTTEQEFECTELVKRYLYLVYGLDAIAADGNQIVSRYTAQQYYPKLNPFYNHRIINDAYGNGKVQMVPVEGDVLSWGSVHTAIVTGSRFDNATSTWKINIIEQNWSSTGFRTLTMGKDWIIDNGVSDWMTTRNIPAIPGGTYNSPPTPKDGSTVGLSLPISVHAFDNSGTGLSKVDITEWHQGEDPNTWPVIKTYTAASGSNASSVDVSTNYIMPALYDVLISFNVYSNNGLKNLAPQGIERFCTGSNCKPYNQPSQNFGGGVQTGCHPTDNQAAFFTAESYQGQCVTLDLGDYSSPENIGLPNDSIESIMVGNNVKATAYQDSDFNGLSETFTSSADTLRTHSINVNTISSLKIFPRGQIRICNGTNYSGVCTQFDEGIHNLDNTGTDECVKSIDFGKYGGLFHVVLWSGNVKPNGNPAHFDNSNANLNYCDATRIRTVEVYRNLPPTASQQLPTNNAGFPVGTQNLDLTYDGGNEFQIHVWGSGYDVWQPWISSKTLHLTGLTSGSYSWQVQGQNEHGVGPWSDVWMFTVAQEDVPQPPTAVQKSPANETTYPSGTTMVNLTYDGGDQFQIHVWGPDRDLTNDWSSSKTTTLWNLKPGTYHWQVVGKNSSDTGQWSGTWTFTINTPPPPTPVPPARTLITVSVLLDGIGIAGDATNPNSAENMNPLHPNRTATVFVYNGSSLIVTKYITISYVNGAFSGAVEVSGTVTGVTIATPGFLVSSVATINAGRTNQITLREKNGDVNRDGVRSSADYDAITACYGSKVASCQYGYNADINDDGVVDGTDVNLWLREA